MKLERMRAINNELMNKPPAARRTIIKRFASRHFIHEATVYRDLQKYKVLQGAKV